MHRSETVLVVGAVVLTVALAVGAEIGVQYGSTQPPFPAVTDLAESLGDVFHPGVILGAGSNSTDTLLLGIGVYTVTPEFSLPVLADLRVGMSGPLVENLTPIVDPYFFEGGTYALGWNGSAWMIGGQATWAGVNDGTLVSLHGHDARNETAAIYPYFSGGGIFALGWNGTSWLLGGNSTWGVSLVGLEGNHVTNLSRLIPSRDPLGWIQLISWNGTEWLIGGQKVFGTLAGRSFHDLMPESPYGGTGVYSGAWNGTAWLAGGGDGRAVVVRDDRVSSGPVLPSAFNQAVLLILPFSGGWVIGGKGLTTAGAIAPELAIWDGSPGSTGVTNLNGLVPGSFARGEIQGGGWAPQFGPRRVVLVGEGGYDVGSGYGIGAMALLSLP